jgi:hypothetical protein
MARARRYLFGVAGLAGFPGQIVLFSVWTTSQRGLARALHGCGSRQCEENHD